MSVLADDLVHVLFVPVLRVGERGPGWSVIPARSSSPSVGGDHRA